MTNDVDGLWSEETQAIDLIDSGKVKVQTMTGGEFLKELEEKVINFFHWYNGQSPLAHCCMQIHPEQFWGNVRGVCICGRTERPKWVIEARRKAEE